LIQRLIALAEGKPDLLGSVPRIVVEARSRHSCHSNLSHQILRKLEIILEPKPADVGHDIIRPVWPEAAEANFISHWHKTITPLAVRFRQLLVVGRRQAYRGFTCLLQRSQ